MQSKSLIDNIFVNTLEYPSYSGNILIEISDHLIQFLILEGFIKGMPVSKINLFKRDFSNFNKNEFEQAVNNFDWNLIVNIDQKDPNLSINNFYNSIAYILDGFAPLQKVTKKEYKLKFKPWTSHEILKQCKERDNILKSISKEDDPEKRLNLYATHKSLRNDITQKERERERVKLNIFQDFLKKIEINRQKYGKV